MGPEKSQIPTCYMLIQWGTLKTRFTKFVQKTPHRKLLRLTDDIAGDLNSRLPLQTSALAVNNRSGLRSASRPREPNREVNMTISLTIVPCQDAAT